MIYSISVFGIFKISYKQYDKNTKFTKSTKSIDLCVQIWCFVLPQNVTVLQNMTLYTEVFLLSQIGCCRFLSLNIVYFSSNDRPEF